MVLEGTVTNVTNFRAFVDIGVHQDELVHISSLSDRFIDDPNKVVKARDIIKVKVIDVDMARKRIALPILLDEQPGEAAARRDMGERRQYNGTTASPTPSRGGGRQSGNAASGNSTMSDALATALGKRRLKNGGAVEIGPIIPMYR